MATWVIFDTFMEKTLDGTGKINIDAGGDTLKIMLIDSTRAPVGSTDTNMSTIDDNEVSGTNYSAGGASLANQIISLAGGTVTFDNTVDITWSQSGAGFTDARYVVLYKSTGTPANDHPLLYADFSGDKGNVDGDLTLEFHASGIFTLSD